MTVEENYDYLIGKKAYKNSRGLYGELVGVVEKSESGISPLCIALPNGMKLGSFPKDLVIVEDEELE